MHQVQGTRGHGWKRQSLLRNHIRDEYDHYLFSSPQLRMIFWSEKIRCPVSESIRTSFIREQTEKSTNRG